MKRKPARKHHRAKKPSSKRRVDASIKKIYMEKGRMPDLTHLVKKPSSGVTRILVKLIVLLLVVCAGVAGWFLLSQQGLFEQGNYLEVSIETEDTVRVGEEFALAINYKNSAKSPLAQLELTLTPPIGFLVTEASPQPTEEGLVWNLGSLSSRSDGRIELRGRMRSEVPSSQRLQALFTYRPGNFSSDFQTVETISIDTRDSVLKTSIQGPDKAIVGDRVVYTVDVQNTGALTMEQTAVLIDIPEGFIPDRVDPSPIEEGENQWRFDQIDPGTVATIELEGTYSSGEEPRIWRATSGLLTDNRFFAQSSEGLQTDVVSADLSLSLISNGSNDDHTIEIGETLRVSAILRNTSDQALEGTVLTLDASSEGEKKMPINWKGADLADANTSANNLRWSAENLETLERFDPGEEVIVDLRLPVTSLVDFSEEIYANHVTFSLFVESAQTGSLIGNRRISAEPLTVTLNADLIPDSYARFFDTNGTPIGSGAMPPRVGETTTYHVIWDLKNRFGEVRDVRMSANLPADVSWIDQASADIGTINFDPITRTIKWAVNGLKNERGRAVFNLSITPQERDVNAFMKLLNPTAVEATDVTTGDPLTKSLDAITTELPRDSEASGNGVVLPSS